MTILKRFLTLSAGVFIISCPTATAIDYGDPVYRDDMTGTFRLEALYEKYDRDIRLKFGSEWIDLPGGDFAFMESAVDTFEADNYALRLGIYPGSKLFLHFDAGVADADLADSSPRFYGAGAKMIAYENRFTGLRVSLLASGHYFPSFDVLVAVLDEFFDRFENKGEADFYELNGGVIFSGIQDLDGDSRVVPYGGLLLSVLQGSFEATHTAVDSGMTFDIDGDIEEEQIFTAIAGLSFILNRHISARIEGRFISQTSISVALGASF